jgi:hypothetical protein
MDTYEVLNKAQLQEILKDDLLDLDVQCARATDKLGMTPDELPICYFEAYLECNRNGTTWVTSIWVKKTGDDKKDWAEAWRVVVEYMRAHYKKLDK